MTAGVMFNTHYVQEYEGVAAFRHASRDPEDLEDLWPRMRERKLQKRHQKHIEPVDAAHRRSLYWALGGLGAMGAGIGIAAAVEDESRTAAAVSGVGGIALGLVGAIAALITQPSGERQVHASARRKLFIPGEDNLVAAARGVDRVNAARRRTCGGKPARPGLAGRHEKASHKPAPTPAPPSAPTVAPPPELRATGHTGRVR